MRLIRKLIALFHPTMQERVDEATKKVGELYGKIANHRHQAKLYAQLLQNVDPDKDWWSWAHLKEKVHSNNAAVATLQIDLANAAAAYHAVRQELDSEKDKEHALSSFAAGGFVTPGELLKHVPRFGEVPDERRIYIGDRNVQFPADGGAVAASEPAVHDIP